MEHDLQLRAAAHAIYDNCYLGEDWAPVGFDDAERFRTVHYRQPAQHNNPQADIGGGLVAHRHPTLVQALLGGWTWADNRRSGTRLWHR